MKICKKKVLITNYRMCGIAGIWKFNGGAVDIEQLTAFTDSMKDRGPDGSGYSLFNENRLGLGHRRLSIIDLTECGKQPMSYGDGRYWITYNGEIYNFLEIKRNLKQKGYVFTSESDTEVILAAYDCWGKDCLKEFNGMFAFAIWDQKRECLFIARDRFGVKPLHYHFSKGWFAFASETYAFGFLQGFNKRVDDRLLAISVDDPQYLEGSGYTIFENIRQLLPGHYMEVFNNAKEIEQKRWWDTRKNLVKYPSGYEKQVEEFGRLLGEACRLRLRSDVPVASALSGGLDSSAIYCIINELLRKGSDERVPAEAQQAFVAYYPGTPNDEKKFAEEVVRFTGGRAEYVETDFKNLVNELISTTVRFDAVGGTPIMCATDVYKAMNRKGYKVSLDGHGADEMLYGYKQMVMDAYQDAVMSGDKLMEEDIIDTYTGLFFPGQWEWAKIYLSKYGDQIRPRGAKKYARMLLPGVVKRRETYNIFDKSRGETLKDKWLDQNVYKGLSPLSKEHYQGNINGNSEQKAYNLFHYTSLPVNFRDFDRASMQSSVEIRCPFVDWNLVSFVFSLPTGSKVGNGFTKRILRDALKGRVPESIRTRKLKIGFSAPLPSWFSGELKEYIADEVNSSEFLQNPVWDGASINKLVTERQKSGWTDFNECSRVWRFLNAHIILNKNRSNHGTEAMHALRA